jgi:DNA-binding transcriptional LysR family regulator
MARFDLNLLGALDALLSERNVTRAAEKLNVTQPTMSGMLQRLRYQFRDQLLVRNGRAMDLTPFAVALCGPVREALSGVEALVRAEPVFDPATSTRSFTITASDYCAAIFLPKIFARLSSEAPGIRLEAQALVQPLERLNAAKVDLWFTVSSPSLLNQAYDKLQSEYLFSDDFVCVVRDGHPLREGCSLEEYLSFPHVAIHFEGLPGSLETLALSRRVPHYRAPYAVSEFSQIPSMVADSDIVGVVQRRLAMKAARMFPIRLFKPPFLIPDLDEVMIWHPRSIADPAHVWLRRTILEVARKWTAEPDAPESLGVQRPLGSGAQLALGRAAAPQRAVKPGGRTRPPALRDECDHARSLDEVVDLF